MRVHHDLMTRNTGVAHAFYVEVEQILTSSAPQMLSDMDCERKLPASEMRRLSNVHRREEAAPAAMTYLIRGL